MILDNTSYDKIKLLYKLSDLCWFIEKHGIPDAQNSGDASCEENLRALQRDLEKHIEKLQRTMCMITQ